MFSLYIYSRSVLFNCEFFNDSLLRSAAHQYIVYTGTQLAYTDAPATHIWVTSYRLPKRVGDLSCRKADNNRHLANSGEVRELQNTFPASTKQAHQEYCDALHLATLSYQEKMIEYCGSIGTTFRKEF